MYNKINWYYRNRQERSKWIAQRFSDFFIESQSFLDVGCWEKDLKKYVPSNSKYFGIDISGSPDKFINLDKIEKLPFNDKEFDLAICSDVLEHLENIHLIFDEILRVSNKYVIITLPTATHYRVLKKIITKKKYLQTEEKRKEFGKYLKFFGLPLEKPDDRHRWFFGLDEAIEFIDYRSNKSNFSLKIIDTDLNYKKGKGKLISKFLGTWNKNLAVSTVMVLLERN